MVQYLLLFLVKLFWHFLNSQLVQANWLLGLQCASCFGTEDSLPKAVHRAQPFGMRTATLQLQIADRRCHQQGGNQLPDCHPFLHRWPAKKVGHPSKLKMRLLALTGRLCRPKWHFASCTWYAKLGTLHTEKIYLLANLSFVRCTEGDEATSPSCAS